MKCKHKWISAGEKSMTNEDFYWCTRCGTLKIMKCDETGREKDKARYLYWGLKIW